MPAEEPAGAEDEDEADDEAGASAAPKGDSPMEGAEEEGMEEAEQEAEEEGGEEEAEEEAAEEDDEEGEEEASEEEDGIDWEDLMNQKAAQLRGLLQPLFPVEGELHPDDEKEVDLILRARGVSHRRKYKALTDACTVINNLRPEPDPEYEEANDSQQSTESQLEGEMLGDEDRSHTPQIRSSELERLLAAPGFEGTPVRCGLADAGSPSCSSSAAAASSAAGPMVGRPPTLVAAGSAARQSLRQLGAMAQKAPLKAKAELQAQREAAPEPSGHAHVVSKSNAASQAIFENAGSLNEVIEVVGHMLRRSEMRPVLQELGYSQATVGLDSMLVDAIAAFIKDYLPAGGGSRSTEKQASQSLLGTAAASQKLLDEWELTASARRLGIRCATFRHLVDSRLKMDAELEDGIEVGALLKVSRLRRKDARDDDAELFDDWSHRICRYDSTQTTGAKKVRRFQDAKADGKVRFEEHERRTLPCSRLELCERFLDSDEYEAFLARKNTSKLNVSFFQKRICPCMVDEKMTQCADPIDTQFNVLFSTWLKLVQQWHDDNTCSIAGCVCKEAGFLEISSRAELWAFIFRGECAPELDPTRGLPRDTAAHKQLRFPCVTAECLKPGCLKDILERWHKCTVQNKEGSATEVSSKKWTPVPRGKAKATNDDDGDEEYDPKGEAEKWSKEMLPFQSSRPDFVALFLTSLKVTALRRAAPRRAALHCPVARRPPRQRVPRRAQEMVEHRERCGWQHRNRQLQDAELIHAAGTPKARTLINFRTDFSARESYEQQDASTGQKPNVGSVCVSIVQHSASTRSVTTYTKEVLSEEDAKGFARKVITYDKGVRATEDKVVLQTDVHFGYARNKGDARFHHTFHQDIISMYKTGKVRHAFAAWHDGKVLPGCKNYDDEEGDKWTEAAFPAQLPDLNMARGFTDGVRCTSDPRLAAPSRLQPVAPPRRRRAASTSSARPRTAPRAALRTSACRSSTTSTSGTTSRGPGTRTARSRQTAGAARCATARPRSTTPTCTPSTTPRLWRGPSRRRARRAGETTRPTSTTTTTTATARTRRARRSPTTTAATTCSSWPPRLSRASRRTSTTRVARRRAASARRRASPSRAAASDATACPPRARAAATSAGPARPTEAPSSPPQPPAAALPRASHRRRSGAARRRSSARASSRARSCACPETRRTRRRTARASGLSTRSARRRAAPHAAAHAAPRHASHRRAHAHATCSAVAPPNAPSHRRACAQEKNTETVMCGPCKLVKGHFSVPMQWLNLDELTDEYAIFSVWPTEQDRIAATHLMGVPDLKWAKVEGGQHYMYRAQYDLCNDQL